MKNEYRSISTAAVVVLLSQTVFAQTPPAPDTTDSQNVRQDMSMDHGARANTLKLSNLVGMKVENLQDVKLGKVNDVALDVPAGRVLEVIVSSGGFLGAGAELRAVPPGALQYDPQNRVLRLDISQDKFTAAPRFDRSQWPDCGQTNRIETVYTYYNVRPWYVRNESDVTPMNDGRAMDKLRVDEATGKINDEVAALAQPGAVHSGNKILGTTVTNEQNEVVGRVNNMIVDLVDGRVVAVVLSTSGAGSDRELTAVPPSVFHGNADNDALVLSASADTVARSPHFARGTWPNFDQSDYDAGFYQAYQVPPYFSTNAASLAADSSAQNERYWDNRTVTPLDQGNSQSDINITAQIRKGILAATEMSVDAQNVKIITKDGHVTLLGPVKTAEEKQHIEEIASRVAQPENVTDKLEIIHNPTTTVGN